MLRVALLVGSGLAIILGGLIAAVLAHPPLPATALGGAGQASGLQAELLPPVPPASAAVRAQRLQAIESRQERQAVMLGRKPSTKGRTRAPARPGMVIAEGLLRSAFIAADDPAAAASLRLHRDDLDLVWAPWLLLDGDGVADAPGQADLRSLLTAAGITSWMPVATVAGDIDARLRSSGRLTLVADLVERARRAGGRGLCLDLAEMVLAAGGRTRTKVTSRPAKRATTPGSDHLVPFVQDLATTLHAAGLGLAVVVPADHATFPYRPLGVVADLVLVDSCRRSPSTPGPLASQSWFTAVLTAAAREVPPAKLVAVVGNQAWDWSAGDDSEEIAVTEAWRLARLAGAAWRWDQGNPGFAYREADGVRHQVWALDACTAFNQLAAVQAAGARGVVLYGLGREDPTLWRIWEETVFDAASAQSLADVPTGAAVEHVGTGEVLRIAGTPTVGRRTIAWQGGTIVDSAFTTYPTAYVISHHGHAPGKVVLTFDDGPDPAWTPAILDILERERVPAVFFVVGAQAEAHPGLLDRIAVAGHEIGNHTFTHPNLLKIPLAQLDLELSATQRLIESRSGRGTVLFRPPFGIDSEPRSLDEIKRIEAADQLGYLTVGMNIDPRDWEDGVSADAIVQRIRDGVGSGAGSIVLLHDAGGDRAATVAALPRIIAGLRSADVVFTDLAGLLGVPREQLLPMPTTALPVAWLQGSGFTLLSWAWRILGGVFTIGVVLGIARLLVVTALALVERRRAARRRFDLTYRPTVAVVVPAYNEETVIVATVRSLLRSDWPALAIVVIDDGSKDATHAVAAAAFAGEPRVTILTKPNGGKSSALTYAITRCSAEIVVVMDADTVFRPETIARLVRHFSDPRVAAVAGNAKVGNRISLLTRWQALEYVTCQNLDRRAFACLNAITVVPGAVGAWRRQVVLNAGGFTHRTLAEDADLTMTLVRKGYVVRNEPEAIALTEAPDGVRALLKQRFRWTFGTLQAAIHHLGALGEPRSGAFGWLALPNILVFQVLFPLLSPLIDLALLVSLISWGMTSWHHPGQAVLATPVLFWYLAFVAVDMAAAWIAFRMEPAEDRRLLIWLFAQRFGYRQLMYLVAIRAIVAALRGRAVGWGKLERKGMVGV